MKTVVKAHVGRWSEDCPEHQGCVVYSMADIPLGFGVVSGLPLISVWTGNMLTLAALDRKEYDRGTAPRPHRYRVLPAIRLRGVPP